MAIEAPALPTNNIFLYLQPSYGSGFCYARLNSFYACNVDLNETKIAKCGDYRFLLYRPSRNDLVGSYGNTVASINTSNGACTTLVSNLIQPNGIAEDTEGNLFIADTGAGKIIKRDILGNVSEIAQDLSGPTGLAFDSVTGYLFISETTAGRITTLPVGIAFSGKIKLKIKNTSGSWSSWITAPNMKSPDTPAACVDEIGNLYVFVRNIESGKIFNAVYMSKRAPAGTWSTWTKVPGTMLTASSPTAVCEPGGIILLYVRGLLDDKVYESAYTIAGKTWGAWKVVPGQSVPFTPDNPETTIDQSGNVYLLIRGMQ